MRIACVVWCKLCRTKAYKEAASGQALVYLACIRSFHAFRDVIDEVSFAYQNGQPDF